VVATSSTKKAARLAGKGKGRAVRFQGGRVFPIAIMVTVVLGVASIVYARQSVPLADDNPPTINDHWHMAYGFDICGEWFQLQGDLEERNSQGQFVNPEFLQTGIHSHDDGVIHWHPYTSRAVGSRAQLGVFLETYGVELTNESLTFPADQLGGASYTEGEDTCTVDGVEEQAELSVVAWTNYTDTDDGSRYISKMDEIPVTDDGMVFVVAFLPRGDDVSMPPWAAQLLELGAVDMGQLRPEDLTSTSVGATTGTDSVETSVPDSGSSETTVVDDGE
jgi:hypothetical protein